MIVIRQCELGKVINKRVEKTRQKKNLKTRYKHEDGESKNLAAKNPCSFRIEKEWYNDDESVYDANKTAAITILPNELNTNYYMGKIKELQEELKMAKKVLKYFICLILNFRTRI